MSADYIRQHYKVPVRRYGRIRYDGDGEPRFGTMVWFPGAYIRVRFDDSERLFNLHPTWKVTYLLDHLPTPDDASTRHVALSNGGVAIVDVADYDEVIVAGPWRRDLVRRPYARRSVPGDRWRSGTEEQSLHTFLTGWDMVDHINGDGLDNRRCNLRPATERNAQNCGNKLRSKNNTSGYKGVSWHKASGRWSAGIKVNYVRRHLGLFDTAEEAARAYDAAAVEAFGEFAHPNFPRGERAA